MKDLKKYSVLIIEDEFMIIEILENILESEYTVHTRTNGADGLKAARELIPDVIILDVVMPEADGYEVLSALKSSELTKHIPVIFITGLNETGAEEKGLSLGAADYITKPFFPAIVNLRLKNQIKILEQSITKYDLMKYQLANSALNIALWDMNVVSGDPINPVNEFTWSQEFRAMLGFADENEFPNVLQSWSGRLHPDDKERVLTAFAAHIVDFTGRTPYDLEYRLMLKSGKYRYFRAFGDTLRDAEGTPLRVAGAIMDIDDKKRMEKSLAKEKERTRLMLDSSPLCCHLWDRNLNAVDCNEAAVKLYGFNNKDEYMKEFAEKCYPIKQPDGQLSTQKMVSLVDRTFDEGFCVCYWIFQIPGDGSPLPAEVTLVRVPYGDDFVVAVYTRDLREHYKMMEKIQQAKIAEENDKTKSRFLANMSHEIRTPMNAILGITEILLQDETLSDETIEGLDKIYSSCDLLLGIINDILDFSKIEAGKIEIVPAEYQVASLINDSVNLNMMRIGSKPIEFKIEINENTLSKLVGDELRIKQILNNMLSNAFKYTERGTVTFSVDFEECNDGKNVILILSIRDTGRGMTPEQVEKMFVEYTRFTDDCKNVVEGTGLGLAISQNLINLMNGEIKVESEPGKGSLFTVRLPQGTIDSEVIGKKTADNLKTFRSDNAKNSSRLKIEREPMPYGKVLVVDDVQTNLYVVMGLLKFYELQVETASSGFGAIEKVNSGKEYDIIFMDYMMPGMNGLEATKHLRNFGYTAPIVALTADAVVGRANVFLQSGFDSFISKPIDIRQLNAVLNKFIRDKQPPEVIEAAHLQRSRTKVIETVPKVLTNKTINGLDIIKGVARYEGNEKPYLQILRKFAACNRSLLVELENVKENKLRDYKVLIHGFKGACFEIYANQLGEMAKALEEASKYGDMQYINEHNKIFIEAAGKIIDDLEAMFKVIDEENPKPVKECLDPEILTKLHEACTLYSMNDIEAAMNEIERYQYEQGNELADWLREKADMMEFSEIEDKLSSLGYN